MCNKRFIISILCFVAAAVFQRAAAQEIKGDTIYTSVSLSVVLQFPDSVTTCVFSDTMGNRYHTTVLNSFVVLRAKIEKVKPAVLKIREGNRSHSFVVVFKKNISMAQLSYKWPDEETLKNYVAGLAAKNGFANVGDSLTMQVTNQNPQDSDALTRARNDKYDSVVANANMAMSTMDFAKATEHFSEAHAIKPDETLPLTMLKQIESTVQAMAKKKRYTDSLQLVLKTREAIANADKKILSKDWNGALILYEEAILMRPTPLQMDYVQKKVQAINAEFERLGSKPDTAHALVKEPVNNEKAIEQPAALTNNTQPGKEEEKRVAEENLLRRKLQISNMMDKGQQAFAAKNWDSAKVFYKQAIALYPSRDRELFARKRLEEINQQLSEKDDKNQEQKSVLKTNNLTAFDATHPVETGLTAGADIAETDSLQLSDNEKTIKLSLEVDELLALAQKAIMRKDWDSARGYYQQILALNPSGAREEFAKKKLEVIDFEIAKTALPVSVVKEGMTTHDNDTVQTKLERTQAIRDASNVAAQKKVMEQAAGTEKELTATQNEQDRLFQRKLKISEMMDKAQQAFIAGNWDSAKVFYKSVIDLNPSFDRVAFAKKRIAQIEAEIREAKEASVAVKEPIKDVQVKENMPLPNIASEEKKAAPPTKADEKTEAKTKTTTKLAEPLAEMNGKSTETAFVQSVKSGDSLKNSLTAVQSKKSNQNTVMQKAADTAGQKSNIIASDTSESQYNSFESKAGEKKKEVIKDSSSLKANGVTKLPTVNKSVAVAAKSSINPATNNNSVNYSRLDSAATQNKEYNDFSEVILKRNSRLHLADSSNFLQLVCEDIVFKGSNVYMKLLLHNGSSASFPSDTLRLTYIKNYGILKKLKARYLSDVPQVLPGKEASFVYATEAVPDVEPNEIFILEVEDKLMKSKLTIHIPGDVYNRFKTD